jgi:hypothetical protein
MTGGQWHVASGQWLERRHGGFSRRLMLDASRFDLESGQALYHWR